MSGLIYILESIHSFGDLCMVTVAAFVPTLAPFFVATLNPFQAGALPFASFSWIHSCPPWLEPVCLE